MKEELYQVVIELLVYTIVLHCWKKKTEKKNRINP